MNKLSCNVVVAKNGSLPAYHTFRWDERICHIITYATIKNDVEQSDWTALLAAAERLVYRHDTRPL